MTAEEIYGALSFFSWCECCYVILDGLDFDTWEQRFSFFQCVIYVDNKQLTRQRISLPPSHSTVAVVNKTDGEFGGAHVDGVDGRSDGLMRHSKGN